MVSAAKAVVVMVAEKAEAATAVVCEHTEGRGSAPESTSDSDSD